VTFASSEQLTVVATVWKDEANAVFYMNLWQTDPYRYLTMWSWNERPGQNCLAGGGGEFDFGEIGTHAFNWGLVTSDVDQVRVVMTDQGYSAVAIGPEVLPGLRPWMAEHTLVEVDRFETRAASGNIVHTATAPTWDAYPDTC
jgi:hypothetical protein